MSTRKPLARWKRQNFFKAYETTMYINLYAIIVGLIGTLFIVTKMRHPHVKYVRESLERSVLFKVINALDFYTGNHALFYDKLFPEPRPKQSKDPLQSTVSAICLYTTKLPSPHVDHSYFFPKQSPGAGVYQILPALCATAGVFLFSTAVYLRKNLRLALRENQRNVVIYPIQIKRRASQSQEINAVLSASNANPQHDVLVSAASVSVVTRRDDPIFYLNADPVVVAPPMPVAISNPLLRTNSLLKSSSQSFQRPAIQSGPATPLTIDSPPLFSPSTLPSATETPVAQTDDNLPYSIPLPQDEPELVIEEKSPGASIEPSPSPVEIKSDVTDISYFAYLPFAQDLDAQRSATPTPAPSPGRVNRGNRSPRYLQCITEPTTPSRPVSTPQVSCRRPDWLTSAQYWEAHSRLNALVSNTAARIETASDATGVKAPVISPAEVTLDSPSPSSYKIRVPRVRATTSLAQPTTVSGSASYWEHPTSSSVPAEAPFVSGRTGADLVLAMSTNMPRVVDLRVGSAGGGRMDYGGEWTEASGSGISPLAEMSVSPRASLILRQVAAAAAQASPPGSSRSRRRPSAVTAAVLQTPWLNRTGTHDSGGDALPATVTRSTGVSPVQTAVRTSVMRRVLGPRRGGSAGRPSERWIGPGDSVERPPLRITRIFGEPAA